MAPAHILDLPQTQINYTHKKFQGNRYAHKKFGTRSLPPTQEQLQRIANKHQIQETVIVVPPTTNKRSSGDLFRPYALGENTPRKRKFHELQDEEQHPSISSCTNNMDSKRFAPSPVISPVFLPSVSPTAFTSPPSYRLQQYHFNPQTFALILQKQQAALCMGEMLKRQTNFNLYNVMGK